MAIYQFTTRLFEEGKNLVPSMPTLNLDLTFAFLSFLTALTGAMFDVLYRRIPNYLTGSAILLGLLLQFLCGGWRQMFSAAAAGLICGAVLLVFYLAGGMGAGDVKLIAAVACFAGLSRVGPLLLLTALAGGAMAIIVALRRGQLKHTLVNIGALAVHHRFAGLRPHPELNVLNTQALRLPYGLAIAVGSSFTLYLQVAQG